jgi:anti-sigma B factor antagonist
MPPEGGLHMPLKIDVAQSKPGIARVSLDGSLDSDTAPALDKALTGVDAKVLLVILDMQNLAFISSAGLRVVFAALKRQEAKGGELVIVNMGPGIRKVFEIVKALPSMNVFASVQEMDNYLAIFQKRQT